MVLNRFMLGKSGVAAKPKIKLEISLLSIVDREAIPHAL